MFIFALPDLLAQTFMISFVQFRRKASSVRLKGIWSVVFMVIFFGIGDQEKNCMGAMAVKSELGRSA